jgi:hypothetical protein
MAYYMCSNCEYNLTCRKTDMPLISPISRHILRWHVEQKTVPGYPRPGTWEDQPVWFTNLMAIAANANNRLEREAIDG